jgi:hypothetical protein
VKGRFIGVDALSRANNRASSYQSSPRNRKSGSSANITCHLFRKLYTFVIERKQRNHLFHTKLTRKRDYRLDQGLPVRLAALELDVYSLKLSPGQKRKHGFKRWHRLSRQAQLIVGHKSGLALKCSVQARSLYQSPREPLTGVKLLKLGGGEACDKPRRIGCAIDARIVNDDCLPVSR